IMEKAALNSATAGHKLKRISKRNVLKTPGFTVKLPARMPYLIKMPRTNFVLLQAALTHSPCNRIKTREIFTAIAAMHQKQGKHQKQIIPKINFIPAMILAVFISAVPAFWMIILTVAAFISMTGNPQDHAGIFILDILWW